jgi:DNA-binding transcriptional MerR regulator
LNKSPEAFRTISEAAEELDLPQHVLRFWETRFAQIKPMKRGGGRRYYRPADVDLLKGIRHLLYDKGYTIRGVQRILREESVPHVVAIGRGDIVAGPQTPEPQAAGEDADPPAAAAPPASGLSEAQTEELRLAMEDLTAARRLLGP